MAPDESPQDLIYSVRIAKEPDESVGSAKRHVQSRERPDVTVAEFLAKELSWQPPPGEGRSTATTSSMPAGPPSKIHPLLLKWIQHEDANSRRELIVTFRDRERIPRFPDLDPGQPLDSKDNEAARRSAAVLVEEIKRRRAAEYARLTDEVLPGGVETGREFWLVKAIEVTMELGAVDSLAESTEVQYVEPQFPGDPPPHPNNDPDDDPIAGRKVIGSDAYLQQGLGGDLIALLDTGVRSTHEMLHGVLRSARDCVAGNVDCNGGNPDDTHDHGTSAAAIISGNASQGPRFQGVTKAMIDSFRIYSAGGLIPSAAIAAFETAIDCNTCGANVICAEIQSSEDYTGAIAEAADNAFDAGRVVVAANGNQARKGNVPGGSVTSPASAHRVIGVGCFDATSGKAVPDQSRGPTLDKRTKPDIQAPTGTETASSSSDTAFQNFGMTSGATPYAAGAAALAREMLRGNSISIDPGHVYAYLILAGSDAPPFDNIRGCGPIQLPTGKISWGKTSVTQGKAIPIQLKAAGDSAGEILEGAIWWPESTGEPEVHNHVGLYLLDPASKVRAQSAAPNGVFQKVRVTGKLNAGIWMMVLYGWNVDGAQTIYWVSRSESP